MTFFQKLCVMATGLMVLGGCFGREAEEAPEQKPPARAEAPDPPAPAIEPHPGTVMQRKLVHAQKLLRSITREDFKAIGSQARALSALSGEADWKVHQTLTYLLLSDQFKAVCSDMEKHAKKKQVEAVTLDYMHMVLTCVKCHRHMRHEGLAVGDLKPLEALAKTTLSVEGR